MKKSTILITSIAAAVVTAGISISTSADTTMYRVYNPNSGEHFYTAKADEKNNLVSLGWRDEGTGWIAPDSGDPVYRLYNANAGDHHYTTSAYEKDQLVAKGWSFEGIGWYSGGPVALYRSYNPNATAGAHNYTTSQFEAQHLVSLGWRDEGTAWYGLGTGAAAPTTNTGSNTPSSPAQTTTPSSPTTTPTTPSTPVAPYANTQDAINHATTGPNSTYTPGDIGADLNNFNW